VKNHLCALHSDMCFICSSILLQIRWQQRKSRRWYYQ